MQKLRGITFISAFISFILLFSGLFIGKVAVLKAATTSDTGGLIAQIYINGNLDSSYKVPGMTQSNDVVMIGRQGYMFEPYSQLEFKGCLDDLRVYNQALSYEKIQSLYQMGNNITAVQGATLANGALISEKDYDSQNWTEVPCTSSTIDYRGGKWQTWDWYNYKGNKKPLLGSNDYGATIEFSTPEATDVAVQLTTKGCWTRTSRAELYIDGELKYIWNLNDTNNYRYDEGQQLLLLSNGDRKQHTIKIVNKSSNTGDKTNWLDIWSYSYKDNSAALGIKVTIDGVQQTYPQSPIILNDRVMIPMRSIFESLGATISWNENTQTVTARKGKTVISMTIGAPVAYKGATIIPLDQPAVIINDRSMVPVRFVGEALGCRVNWVSETRTVEIRQVEEIHPYIEYNNAPQGSEYLYPRWSKNIPGRLTLAGEDGFPGDITTDNFAIFEKPGWGLGSFTKIANASLDAAKGQFATMWMLELQILASESELTKHYNANVFHLTRYHLYKQASKCFHYGNGFDYILLRDKAFDNSINYLGNEYVREECTWVGVYDDRNPNTYLLVFPGKWIPVCQTSFIWDGFEWEGDPLINTKN